LQSLRSSIVMFDKIPTAFAENSLLCHIVRR
jgi:hypothetical protein